MSAVRLTDFAAITGRSKESLRNAQNKKNAPWDEDLFDAGYRKFDASHGIAVVASEMLQAQGVLQSNADSTVRENFHAIERYCEARMAGKFTSEIIAHIAIIAWDTFLDGISCGGGYVGNTYEEVFDWWQKSLEEVGVTRTTRRGLTSERTLAAPSITFASIHEAYLILFERALRVGFTFDVDGRTFIRLQADN